VNCEDPGAATQPNRAGAAVRPGRNSRLSSGIGRFDLCGGRRRTIGVGRLRFTAFPVGTAAFVTLAVTVCAGAGAAQMTGVGADDGHRFDVASIRPLDSGSRSQTPWRILWHPGGRFESGAFLRALIQYAYGLRLYERVEGAWDVLDERFVVMARLEDPVTAVQSQAAVRRLLAERFNLSVRQNEEVRPVAVLRRISQDRLGPAIRSVAADCPRTGAAREERAPAERHEGEARQPPCNSISLHNGRLHVVVSSMSQLATGLSGISQGPIIDETGLGDGPYELDITFDPATLSPRSPAIEGLPSFEVVLRTNLGWRVDREHRPLRRLTVEHVERPAPD
jgi:uncharacterized protein (TIGR03435 family)